MKLFVYKFSSMYFSYKDQLKTFFLDVCRKLCENMANNYKLFAGEYFDSFLAFKHKYPRYFELQRSFQLPSYEVVEKYVKEIILSDLD